MRLFRALIAAILVASLTLSASAAFTPSIEYKDAPEIVVTTDAEGNAVAGTVLNAEGEVLAAIPAEVLVVTPISAVAKEETPVEVAEKLTAVKEELTAALEAKEENDLVKAVSEALNNAPAANIVVSDVFTITADETLEEALELGAKIAISLTSQNITKADEEKITIWQKNAVTGEWKPVAFKIDENNIINLELEDLGEIVIFRDSEAAPETPKTAPRSPKTRPTTKNRFNAFVKLH